jgi:hypothetical protein
MRKLRRHAGHFVNWYDTRTLQPLTPVGLLVDSSTRMSRPSTTARCPTLAVGWSDRLSSRSV